MNGVIVLDKPAGLTSHDVVNQLRRLLGQRSVGHLGTLDPAATGVLPMVVGSFTRLSQFYNDSEKSYEGSIRFGFATDTYDADGEPSTPSLPVLFKESQLKEIAKNFQGEIEQVPPPFSAKKIHGLPAYKLARKKKAVELTPARVRIKEFEIVCFSGERARFQAKVSSGTYMRCIAHDLGQQLGCGAHLESLRRTGVAEFSLEYTHHLEEVAVAVEGGRAAELFVHPRKLLPHIPTVTATDESVAKIRAGRSVNLPELSSSRLVKVFYGQRELIAIASRVAGTLFHPKVVLAAASEPATISSL